MFAALNTVEPPILDRVIASVLDCDKTWYEQRVTTSLKSASTLAICPESCELTSTVIRALSEPVALIVRRITAIEAGCVR